MTVTRGEAAAPEAVSALEQPAASSGGRRAVQWPRRWPPLSLLVILVPALVGAIRLLVAVGRPFDFIGDDAVLEAAIRRVPSGMQALGPYSRYQFHHPGPAYFFFQAPFYWLTGGSARSLFVGALTLNFGCAAGAVLVVRRFLGEQAARWAALVIAAYLLLLQPVHLTDPWNPSVLALPLLLTLTLGAAAAAGSVAAWAGCLVVGSYLVQTHLGTIPVVAVTLAIAASAAAVRVAAGRARRVGLRRVAGGGRSPHAGGGRRLVLLTGCGALLALVWIPPLVEQATGSPGNLTATARFFTQAHPDFDRGVDHRLTTAAAQMATQLTVLPFGPPDRQRFLTPARPARRLVAVVGLVVAVAVMAGGRRRREPFLVALGGLSLTSALVAVWSTTRIVGPVLVYLVDWTSGLLLPAWIGAAAFVPSLPRRSGRPRLPSFRGRESGLAALALGAVLIWSMARAPLPPVPHSPEVAGVDRLAGPWLGAQRVREVRVRIGEHDRFPLAAGVLVRLEKEGFGVTVDPEWLWLYGDQFAPSGREQAVLWLSTAAAAPGGEAVNLGAVGDTMVWAGRFETGQTVDRR